MAKPKYRSTFMLPKAVKREWVSALRSGEYRQIDSQLTDGAGGYCCLGVLCKVLGKTDGDMLWSDMPQGIGIGEILTNKDLMEYGMYSFKYPLPTATFALRYNGALEPLSVLNDDKGLTFEEIAALIHTNVQTY